MISLCPILTPTSQEFENFEQFVQNVEKKYRNQYGMVKIVPPPDWVSRSENYQTILDNLIIKRPQYQTLYGQSKNFYFSCKNKRHQQISLNDFKKLAAIKAKQIKHFTYPPAIQLHFWQIYTHLNNELYCPNIEVTLMDSSSKQWELQKLKSFFSEAVKEKIIGLNTSFCFIGAWRTFFNWHIEDLDLSAINFLHEGATKMWYSIHPQDRKKFEDILKNMFPQQSLKCSNFMRHKQVFLNPYKLLQKYPYLRISKMYQNAGQISLAFAEGYHCGFNMGYNIAQAVNYGTIQWLERFNKFKGCTCPCKVGVELEYQQVVKNLQQSRYYQTINNLEAFQKIKIKAAKEIQADQLYKTTDPSIIEEEINKQKTKPINKDKNMIYLAKYKRYFPIQNKNFQIQCQNCHKWRKVTQKYAEEFQKKPFYCTIRGLKCKLDVKQRKQKVQND